MAERQKGPQQSQAVEKELERERYEILYQLEEWLELPVIILGFVWLILLVIELIWGLNPFLNTLVYLIWGVFALDFLLRFFLAPRKLNYLKNNWLTALSLGVPALRIFRIARVARLLRLARATRSLRLVSLVGSINRGMRALRNTLSRRGVGYIAALTVVVLLVGAAGMFAFENDPIDKQTGLNSYGEAVWWTAMIMTTIGSEYWPQTPEGRMLALLLSIYAVAVFGYLTATLASFFIGREAAAADEAAALDEAGTAQMLDETGPAHMNIDVEGGLPSAKSIRALRKEVADLHLEVRALRDDLQERDDRP